MRTITSRLAHYQNRLHSPQSVCNPCSPPVCGYSYFFMCVWVCVCVCLPSAANELGVSRVQVWECLVYTRGQAKPPV